MYISGRKCSILWIKWDANVSQVTKERLMTRKWQSRGKTIFNFDLSHYSPVVIKSKAVLKVLKMQKHLKKIKQLLIQCNLLKSLYLWNPTTFPSLQLWNLKIMSLRKTSTWLHRQQILLVDWSRKIIIGNAQKVEI